MRKKFLRYVKAAALGVASVLAALTISTAEVSAEQPAAEQYRQMFRSGNFYVECQLSRMFDSRKVHSEILTYAGENGKRMRRGYVGDYYFMGSALSHFSGKSNLSAYKIHPVKRNFVGIPKKIQQTYPDFLYRDGKYYRFDGMETLTSFWSNKDIPTFAMLSEEQLDSPALDPDQGWSLIKNELSLPDELAIFFWEDKFHENPFELTPQYEGSSIRTVEKKDYDCDQYAIDLKSIAGTIIAQEIYNALYENGQLVMVQKYLVRNGKESLIRELTVKNITAEVPSEVFEFGERCKIYAAADGDLNDLIGKKVLLEEIGGKQK